MWRDVEGWDPSVAVLVVGLVVGGVGGSGW